MKPAELKQLEKMSPSRLSQGLVARTKSIIDRLDKQGRWVENGRLRTDDQDNPVNRVIDCRTFINHMNTLCTYLTAVR